MAPKLAQAVNVDTVHQQEEMLVRFVRRANTQKWERHVSHVLLVHIL